MAEELKSFVRRIRREKNLSTSDIQKRSQGKISDAYVSKIENGEVQNVSPAKLRALADGLGVSEEEIFRVARGLEPAPESLREMMAETFGGHDLSQGDWQEIEAVVKAMISQKKLQKK